MTQVSSGLTKTQIPTSGEVSVACAMASWFAKIFIPNASPPPAMAEVPSMKRRRDNGAIEFEIEFMVLALNFDLLNQGTDFISIHFGQFACAGGHMDGLADALVGAATADIGHGLVDVFVGGFRLAFQQ